MQSPISEHLPPLIDRRRKTQPDRPDLLERRQFRDAPEEINPNVRELSEAIDQYKMAHRRRFITVEELLDVIQSVGYHK